MQRIRENCVLQSRLELDEAISEARRRGFPLCEDIYKNWDTLLAVDAVTRRVPTSGRILDGGAEVYSMVLPWLKMSGYDNLLGINLTFAAPFERSGVSYQPGDMTKTTFPARSFDAVVCQSVVEHGICLEEYFREMARITKPGGILITSTDYFPEAVDTRGQYAFGSPIHVFSRAETIDLIGVSASHGFVLTCDVSLDAQERVVTWEEFGLSYTFVLLTLERTD